MKEVIRAGFASQQRLVTYLLPIIFIKKSLKIDAVRIDAFFKGIIEKVDFFFGRSPNRGMRTQVAVKRSRTATLGTDDDKIG